MSTFVGHLSCDADGCTAIFRPRNTIMPDPQEKRRRAVLRGWQTSRLDGGKVRDFCPLHRLTAPGTASTGCGVALRPGGRRVCGRSGRLCMDCRRKTKASEQASAGTPRMHDWQKVNRDGAERTTCRKCGCDAAETETDFGCDS